jgi:hypothetical protein
MPGQPVIHHDKYRPGRTSLPFFSGAATKQWSRQAPQRCGDFIGRITERLTGRVKGLTPVFPALLLTIKLAFPLLRTHFALPGSRAQHQEAAGI